MSICLTILAMNFNSFKITDSVRQETRPYVKIFIDGKGCGSTGCNCSPDNFVVISNGTNGLSVELSDKDVKNLIENGRLELFGSEL